MRYIQPIYRSTHSKRIRQGIIFFGLSFSAVTMAFTPVGKPGFAPKSDSNFREARFIQLDPEPYRTPGRIGVTYQNINKEIKVMRYNKERDLWLEFGSDTSSNSDTDRLLLVDARGGETDISGDCILTRNQRDDTQLSWVSYRCNSKWQLIHGQFGSSSVEFTSNPISSFLPDDYVNPVIARTTDLSANPIIAFVNPQKSFRVDVWEYLEYSYGRGWSPATADSLKPSSRNPSIVVDSKNKIYVSYTDATSGIISVKEAQYKTNSTSKDVGNTGWGGNNSKAKLAISPNDELFIVATQAGTGNVRVYALQEGTTWVEVGNLGALANAAVSGSSQPSIVADGPMNIYVSYEDLATSKGVVMHYDGAVWTESYRTPDTGKYMTMERVRKSDDLYIAYSDGRFGGRVTVEKKDIKAFDIFDPLIKQEINSLLGRGRYTPISKSDLDSLQTYSSNSAALNIVTTQTVYRQPDDMWDCGYEYEVIAEGVQGKNNYIHTLPGDNIDYIYGNNGNDILYLRDDNSSASNCYQDFDQKHGRYAVTRVKGGLGNDSFIVDSKLKSQRVSIAADDDSGFDTLYFFDGIKSNNVTFSRSTDNTHTPLIRFRTSTQQSSEPDKMILLPNFFKSRSAKASGKPIDRIVFSDGEIFRKSDLESAFTSITVDNGYFRAIYGSFGNDNFTSSGGDAFYGYEGNDIFEASGGPVAMTGNGGDDTYRITSSSGTNYIFNAAISPETETDIIDLNIDGISTSNVWFYASGSTLTIYILGTSRSVVINYWGTNISNKVDKIRLNGMEVNTASIDSLASQMTSQPSLSSGKFSLDPAIIAQAQALINSSWVASPNSP